MEVILLQDVEKAGKAGEIIKVKDGYARNYLIPNKLAVLRTDAACRILEAKKKKAVKEAEKLKKAAEETAEKISKLSLTIPMESGVNDALFGSVTPEAISHALRQEGMEIDKRSIDIKEPIKKLGIYTIEIMLHPGIRESLRVWVVKK